MRDITGDLSERLTALQAELDEVRRKRQEIDAMEHDIENRLQAIKTTMEWERVLHGGTNGKVRWLGVGVADAVRQLTLEHPQWDFELIRDKLITDGFDFKSKKPGLSVNQALMRLRRGATKSA